MSLPGAYVVNIGNLIFRSSSFFLKEKVKLQISGLHPSSRPWVECSQGTILVSLLFFSVSLAISARVLHFNNSLKSESSGALGRSRQAGSSESNSCY